MKKLLIIFPFVIITLALLFVYRNQISESTYNYVYFSPCDTPIKYSIGEIDSRFNLTNSELLKRSQAAADIWKNAYGKTLFVYDPTSPFTINAVYDERQELSTEANTLDEKLKTENEQLSQTAAAFKERVRLYRDKQAELNADIRYWNERGGAPEDEYNSLQKRQKELEAEAQELQAEAESLNQSSSEFNSQAQVFSETLNKFNEVLKVKPEGGLFTQNGEEKRITIYFNNSENEFTYTLAHEMGHALGLPHNSNPQSIMYPNISLILTPSTQDLNDLATVCTQRSIFQPFLQNIQRNMSSLSALTI